MDLDIGMAMDNDTRGWIMCAVSGVACVIGGSIIYIDILVRMVPGKRNFKLQESNAFLAASLSLSFGVMLYSALNKMLPSSQKSLKQSGYTSKEAAWLLLGMFTLGFVGIQIVSRFIHHHMPSHAVSCDHTHEEDSHHHSHKPSSVHSHGYLAMDGSGHSRPSRHSRNNHTQNKPSNGHATESSPLLNPALSGNTSPTITDLPSFKPCDRTSRSSRPNMTIERRPSMIEVPKRIMSFVRDTKTNCDSAGPCYGYSEPCGNECFKFIASKNLVGGHPSLVRSATGTFFSQPSPLIEESAGGSPILSRGQSTPRSPRFQEGDPIEEACDDANSPSDSDLSDAGDLEAQHHHHVPENAFMSIGLQTSIAIALHKLPEGFITYATNHANPSLGFSVFMALLIHNITEGFALALPLFLALHSRIKAICWAFILGGVSQPLGAGIAAAWFAIAGHHDRKPGEAVYGCMFAVTAGIMTSVALSLFVESMSLNHSRVLCTACGFLGMFIMGISNALTA